MITEEQIGEVIDAIRSGRFGCEAIDRGLIVEDEHSRSRIAEHLNSGGAGLHQGLAEEAWRWVVGD